MPAAVVLGEAFGEVELHSTWFMHIVAGQAGAAMSNSESPRQQ